MRSVTSKTLRLLGRACQAIGRALSNNIEFETGVQVPALRRRCPIYSSMHCVSIDGYRCDCGWPIAETEARFV